MSHEKSSTLGHAMNKAADAVGGLAGQASAATTSRADDFAKSAAISDRYEIEAAQIALARGRAPQIKEVAQKMIDDHTESTRKLEQAVMESQKADASDLPDRLDSRREGMVKHLREAPDGKFDKTYLDQQTAAHEEAVTLMHHFRDEGDCPRLREFAAEVSPVIEGHLSRMKDLQAA